ncbi:hypothetical protein ACO0LB_10065 [Undibacterium sp. SXout7W]
MKKLPKPEAESKKAREHFCLRALDAIITSIKKQHKLPIFFCQQVFMKI